VDCVPSIEPEFNVLFVYSTLSGEFTMVSEWFVDRCRKLGIWSPELLEAIKIVDGDLKRLDLPQDLKNEFCTAFDVDQHYLIQAAAARQVWIDQGQSLNLYANISSLKYL
jgi:ribonucleoside-diphosphate reductase alpha chain